jgi:hypothetical protein
VSWRAGLLPVTSPPGPRWLTSKSAVTAPLILVITAPEKESRHWLKVAGAVLGVLLLRVAGALFALKLARGWRFG